MVYCSGNLNQNIVRRQLFVGIRFVLRDKGMSLVQFIRGKMRFIAVLMTTIVLGSAFLSHAQTIQESNLKDYIQLLPQDVAS